MRSRPPADRTERGAPGHGQAADAPSWQSPSSAEHGRLVRCQPPTLTVGGGTHFPLKHTGVSAEQTLPQAPQFAALNRRSVHRPLQQAWPTGQAEKQTPQLFLSEEVFAQAPAQHVVPAPHTLPHAPQLLRSLNLSTHFPPQQVMPAGQAFPQAPQLPSLVCVSTHMPAQFVMPVGQQTPPEQEVPLGQQTPLQSVPGGTGAHAVLTRPAGRAEVAAGAAVARIRLGIDAREVAVDRSRPAARAIRAAGGHTLPQLPQLLLSV